MNKYIVIKLEDYLSSSRELLDWINLNHGYKIFVSPSTFRKLRVYLGFRNDRAADSLRNGQSSTIVYRQERVPDNRAYAIKQEGATNVL